MQVVLRCLITVFLLASVLGNPSMAQAQESGKQPKVFEGVGLDEKPGDRLPRDVRFKNEQGETVRLGKYFGKGKPVLLTLVYHDCPMLCPMMLGNLTQTLKKMKWTPGGKFEMVSLSFNHREGPKLARQKKKQYVKQLGRPEAAKGWHFLTGTEENIRKVTEAVGFKFKWVPEKEQYAHPAALTFLTSDGTIARYLEGQALNVPPGDVRKALIETANGKIGNVVDQVLLYCFQYDPSSNSYVASAFNIMKLGGVLTMLLLGIGLFILWRREGQQLSELETAEEKSSAGDWDQKLPELKDA